MDNSSFDFVWSKIDNEGFDYCFRSYSDFKEVKDSKFHKLRQAYVDAATELENYIEENLECGEEEEE